MIEPRSGAISTLQAKTPAESRPAATACRVRRIAELSTESVNNSQTRVDNRVTFNHIVRRVA